MRTYTTGLEHADFVANQLVYDATLRNLELIGEAATHVPEEVRSADTDIPWRLVIATRNRLIHAFLGIDDDTVWSIIRDDIPELSMHWNGCGASRAMKAQAPEMRKVYRLASPRPDFQVVVLPEVCRNQSCLAVQRGEYRNGRQPPGLLRNPYLIDSVDDF